MSSSDDRHNLLPLLSQLQAMEDTLTNFMLETILKLQSLTDVKVFLLLEYPQPGRKRRFCGSKELIDAFAGEKGLTFREASDVVVELNSASASLVEKTLPTATKPIGSGRNESGDDVSSPNDAQSSRNADRFSSAPPDPPPPTTPSAFHPSAMMMAWTDGDGSSDSRGSNAPRGDDDRPSPTKRKKFNDVSSTSVAMTSVVGDDLKKETINVVPEYVISDDEEEEEVDETAASFLLADDSENHLSTFGCGVGNANDEQSLHFGSQFQSNVADADTDSFFDALGNPHLERDKLVTLVSAGNPWAAYEKGTTENRLMKSICYSVGKNAALKCPYPFSPDGKEAVQSYWSHHCDLFVRYCARTGLLVEKNSVNVEKMDCLRRLTAVGYIRQSIRDGFKKVAARGKAQLQIQ